MLDLTPTARKVLRKIRPSVGDDGGLRIARPERRRKDPHARFRLSMSRRPREVDTVVEEDGARVFLGPEAAEKLEGQELDARRDDEGRVEFVVRPGEDEDEAEPTTA